MFETIRLGDLTLFVSGYDAEAVDFWDRLRRACIEAADRAQRRLDAAAAESSEPTSVAS